MRTSPSNLLTSSKITKKKTTLTARRSEQITAKIKKIESQSSLPKISFTLKRFGVALPKSDDCWYYEY